MISLVVMMEKVNFKINETIGESKIADLSEHLPKILEKMEKTLTFINEQTEYEDPSGINNYSFTNI